MNPDTIFTCEMVFFRLLYFYPQSILDYQYMYVISTTVVYRDLT